ncbi:MAG TPA: hypothetical protein VF493_02970 [Terriglobales bacterium]
MSESRFYLKLVFLDDSALIAYHRPRRRRQRLYRSARTCEELRSLGTIAQSDTACEAVFYDSVLAANSRLRGGEIKKLRIRTVDLEWRQLIIQCAATKTDAGADRLHSQRRCCCNRWNQSIAVSTEINKVAGFL